jgi:anti-sigma factor RsiW
MPREAAIMRVSCRQCRADIPAYVHHELSARRRQRMHQHLNACADCYLVYRQTRDQDRDLSARLPQIGSASAPQLARVWRGIQAEMRSSTSTHALRWRMRYSVAVAVLAAAMLLPWLFQPQSALALPLPPTPQQHTTTRTDMHRVVAMSTDMPDWGVRQGATPAFQPNDAPLLLTTDTP